VYVAAAQPQPLGGTPRIIVVSLLGIILIISITSSNPVQPREALGHESTLPDSVIRTLLKRHHMSYFRELSSQADSAGRRVFFLYGEHNGETFHEECMVLVLCDSTNAVLDDGKYDLPGNEFSFQDTLVQEARVFYGHCTNRFPRSVVWYQNTLMVSGHWHREYYVVDYSTGKLEGQHLPFSRIELGEIEWNLEGQRCFELPTFDVHNEP